MPYLEKDEILGMQVKKNSAGHDLNGFRNIEVPKKVDILVLGDSQTYGTNASLEENWPSTLGRLFRERSL